MGDNINHPDHYCTGQYECIKVMEEIFGPEEVATYCKLNAFKYLWRCERKFDQKEDIGKADWYLKKSLELMERMDAEG